MIYVMPPLMSRQQERHYWLIRRIMLMVSRRLLLYRRCYADAAQSVTFAMSKILLYDIYAAAICR